MPNVTMDELYVAMYIMDLRAIQWGKKKGFFKNPNNPTAQEITDIQDRWYSTHIAMINSEADKIDPTIRLNQLYQSTDNEVDAWYYSRLVKAIKDAPDYFSKGEDLVSKAVQVKKIPKEKQKITDKTPPEVIQGWDTGFQPEFVRPGTGKTPWETMADWMESQGVKEDELKWTIGAEYIAELKSRTDSISKSELMKIIDDHQVDIEVTHLGYKRGNP